MTKRDFRKRIRNAVNNLSLNTALERAVGSYAHSRTQAFEGMDFDGLRAELRACKEASLSQIPELFERFRQEAEKVGVRVYQAADGPETNKIVLDIAKSHGVKKIVKSKSMVTEETELNKHLIAAGMEVTETDLGEWIIQLAGERPSNLTIPAIHKTREDVAALFSKVLGEEISSDIPTLVEVARRQMRQKFIEADMGISGANIAIADTGSLVIVSNEGNARLVTSLPDVHVAVVGYDKLVPSIDEATAILKLLSKSGTGQKMTSYVSFITGPSRTSDIEKTLTIGCHGPREVHIIFVDNGRLKLLNDPDFREALYCIKCGACLSVCPVYRSVGGHVFGHMYFGGIGAILESFLGEMDTAEEIGSICSTCGRCMSYCPANIDVPGMITTLRKKLSDRHGQPWIQRMILSKILGNPERFDAALKIGRIAQKLVSPKNESIKSLPYPLSGLTKSKTLPVLAEKPLHERLPAISPAKSTKLGTVAFYPGCVIENIYPEIGEAVTSALTNLGWEVRLPGGQGCCGIPAVLKGDEETARSLARHNVNIPEFQSADYVITACPTCAIALKEEFVRLLDGNSGAETACKISEKTYNFSEFLLKTAKISPLNLPNQASGTKFTYHDPCHAKHGQGISSEPRELLQYAGYELVEMKDPDVCCGFAGSYSVSYPEISESMLGRKLKNIQETDVPILATDCPGCVLQLRGALEKAGSDMIVAHTAEIIAKAVCTKED